MKKVAYRESTGRNTNRTSMFDPFYEDIKEWCNSGMTLKQAYEMLPEGYSFSGFYSYLRANNLYGRNWGREVDKRKKCEDCEYCKTYKNSMGKMYKMQNKICTRHWRLIGQSVKYCPRWCDLEGETNAQRTDREENS